MPRPTNIQTGRQKAVKILGLKELQQEVNKLKDRATGEAVNNLMIDAASILYDQAQSNLRAVNAPHEVRNDVFIYGKNKSALLKAEKSVTCLVGLRKRGIKLISQGYVEWYANRQTGTNEKTSRIRSKRQHLNVIGTKIGENLGTMWELGTTKMSARPWWRPAVLSARSAMFSLMATGLKSILGRTA